MDRCKGKYCDPKKICNPETGRCVLRTGRIGQRLMPKDPDTSCRKRGLPGQCKAITKQGTRCTRCAKEQGFCGIHSKNLPQGPKIYRYFGSSATKDMRLLSNLSTCTIKGKVPYSNKTYTFPSAEHYYVAYFKCKGAADPVKCVERLAEGGDLSTWDGLRFLYKPKQVAQKKKYWEQRGIGIIAKMFGNTIDKKELASNEEEYRKMWIKILSEKYSQNEKHRDILLSTGDAILVEQSNRMKNPNERWGAIVIGGEDLGNGMRKGGTLLGKNYMGNMMTYIRDEFRKQTKKR